MAVREYPAPTLVQFLGQPFGYFAGGRVVALFVQPLQAAMDALLDWFAFVLDRPGQPGRYRLCDGPLDHFIADSF